MFDLGLVDCFIYCFIALNGISNFELNLNKIKCEQNFAEKEGKLFEIKLNEKITLDFGLNIYFRNYYYFDTFTYVLELQILNPCDFVIITEYTSEFIVEDGGHKLRFTTNEIIDKVKFKIFFPNTK
jgi:hypothetical protein